MATIDTVRKKYQPTIGIECHVQLKTKTKLFSAAGNDARQARPNTLISHIDTGMPGALPVLNQAAVELSARAAFALNTRPQKHSYFERKHYFYPDSPAGYQISQLQAPIIVGGSVDIETDGQKKTIKINRAQLEADAGKNTHPEGADYSLVDLNRSGTPLLEIISEPEINSAAEAKAYARELYLLMKYADISNVDLYHGNMRFDVNVSVSAEAGKLGKRTEVKNLNSFRSVENAVKYEIERQIELLDKGQAIVQETRGWDEAKQKTVTQRVKEEAHDYRYMPEPDIPPVELDEAFVSKIKSEMPKLPSEIRKILNKLSISSEVVEEILEWPNVVPIIIEHTERWGVKSARMAALWILQPQLEKMRSEGRKLSLEAKDLEKIKQLTDMVEEKKLSTNSGAVVFRELFYGNMNDSPGEIAKRLNLVQVSDEAEIEKIVAEVLSQNQKAAEDVKNGEAKAIGFLVGQVMAKSQGSANPQIAQQIIKKQLGL